MLLMNPHPVSLIQVEAGGEEEERKRKARRSPEKVKHYQVDVRQCLPMTIVAFSLGSTLHLMTDLERLNSYHQFTSTCFR